MDKFEYELKVEQIEKLIHRGDYVTAKKIADGMEFKKEKDTRKDRPAGCRFNVKV